MYKILNLIFGWDYIVKGRGYGIARIHNNPYEKYPYYWESLTIDEICSITDKNQVHWLTCEPEKYLPKEKL